MASSASAWSADRGTSTCGAAAAHASMRSGCSTASAIAAASAAASPAGTTRPLRPGSTTSSGPSVSVVITGTPRRSASRVSNECDSRITDGITSTSVAARTASRSAGS